MTNESCTNKLLIRQIRGTCWANAVMTALFYSDGMAQILKDKSKNWKKTKSLEIIRDILEKQHNKTQGKLKHSEQDYSKFFEDFQPETLLKALHIEDPKLFEHDPDKKDGYFSGRYLYKVMKYLGISNFHLLDALETPSLNKYDLYYGQYNVMDMVNGYKKFRKATEPQVKEYFAETPDVLLIMTKKTSDKQFYPSYYRKDSNITFNEKIVYNGHVYIADSMILSNYNQYLCHKGHEIAGVTCGKHRYMYNGWIARTIDTGITEKIFRKVPCALMKHDWLDMSKTGFCIDASKCNLKFNANAQKEAQDICFSFSKGPRNYVYIREDLLKPKQIPVKLKEPHPQPQDIPKNPQDIPKKPQDIPKKPQKIPVKLKDPKLKDPKLKDQKTCPDGKILNPATNRCVDINGKLGKELLQKIKA
jgi:hypothetical protein